MDMQLIGKKLRQLRGDRTLNEVSEATGIGVSALGNYEAGLRMPRDDAKIELANYFGMSIGELFYPDEITKRED